MPTSVVSTYNFKLAVFIEHNITLPIYYNLSIFLVCECICICVDKTI